MSTELHNINRILIINLAFIGDVLLSTPVSRALRQAYPGARIDMLVIPAAQGIAELNPYVDNVYAYDKKGRHKKLSELFKLIRMLRANRYDLAVSTNFAMRGAMVAWAAGARYRVGYDAQHAGWFLTHAASANRPGIQHETDNQLLVLKPLELSTQDTSLVLNLKQEDKAAVASKVLYDGSKPLVLICPAGSYARKSWTVAGYAELIKKLSTTAYCTLIGGKAEQTFLEEINHDSGNLAQVLAGTLNLAELAVLISQAKLLVTVDTAPLHIAQAVGTPVIALFGPTDPRVWGPRGVQDVIIYHPTDCSPCWGKSPCEERRCMNTIKAAEVIEAARAMLESRVS